MCGNDIINPSLEFIRRERFEEIRRDFSNGCLSHFRNNGLGMKDVPRESFNRWLMNQLGSLQNCSEPIESDPLIPLCDIEQLSKDLIAELIDELPFKLPYCRNSNDAKNSLLDFYDCLLHTMSGILTSSEIAELEDLYDYPPRPPSNASSSELKLFLREERELFSNIIHRKYDKVVNELVRNITVKARYFSEEITNISKDFKCWCLRCLLQSPPENAVEPSLNSLNPSEIIQKEVAKVRETLTQSIEIGNLPQRKISKEDSRRLDKLIEDLELQLENHIRRVTSFVKTNTNLICEESSFDSATNEGAIVKSVSHDISAIFSAPHPNNFDYALTIRQQVAACRSPDLNPHIRTRACEPLLDLLDTIPEIYYDSTSNRFRFIFSNSMKESPSTDDKLGIFKKNTKREFSVEEDHILSRLTKFQIISSSSFDSSNGKRLWKNPMKSKSYTSWKKDDNQYQQQHQRQSLQYTDLSSIAELYRHCTVDSDSLICFSAPIPCVLPDITLSASHLLVLIGRFIGTIAVALKPTELSEDKYTLLHDTLNNLLSNQDLCIHFFYTVFCATSRYETLFGSGCASSGKGLQSATPPAVHESLDRVIGFAPLGELFASPFNSQHSRFCSLFPMIDSHFGSRGGGLQDSTWDQIRDHGLSQPTHPVLPVYKRANWDSLPRHGYWLVNPPFEVCVANHAVHRAIATLEEVKSKNGSLSFLFILPLWHTDYEYILRDLPVPRRTGQYGRSESSSPDPNYVAHGFTRLVHEVPSGEAFFVNGHQHSLHGSDKRLVWIAPFATLMILLSTDEGEDGLGNSFHENQDIVKAVRQGWIPPVK